MYPIFTRGRDTSHNNLFLVAVRRIHDESTDTPIVSTPPSVNPNLTCNRTVDTKPDENKSWSVLDSITAYLPESRKSKRRHEESLNELERLGSIIRHHHLEYRNGLNDLRQELDNYQEKTDILTKIVSTYESNSMVQIKLLESVQQLLTEIDSRSQKNENNIGEIRTKFQELDIHKLQFELNSQKILLEILLRGEEEKEDVAGETKPAGESVVESRDEERITPAPVQVVNPEPIKQKKPVEDAVPNDRTNKIKKTKKLTLRQQLLLWWDHKSLPTLTNPLSEKERAMLSPEERATYWFQFYKDRNMLDQIDQKLIDRLNLSYKQQREIKHAKRSLIFVLLPYLATLGTMYLVWDDAWSLLLNCTWSSNHLGLILRDLDSWNCFTDFTQDYKWKSDDVWQRLQELVEEREKLTTPGPENNFPALENIHDPEKTTPDGPDNNSPELENSHDPEKTDTNQTQD